VTATAMSNSLPRSSKVTSIHHDHAFAQCCERIVATTNSPAFNPRLLRAGQYPLPNVTIHTAGAIRTRDFKVKRGKKTLAESVLVALHCPDVNSGVRLLQTIRSWPALSDLPQGYQKLYEGNCRACGNPLEVALVCTSVEGGLPVRKHCRCVFCETATSSNKGWRFRDPVFFLNAADALRDSGAEPWDQTELLQEMSKRVRFVSRLCKSNQTHTFAN